VAEQICGDLHYICTHNSKRHQMEQAQKMEAKKLTSFWRTKLNQMCLVVVMWCVCMYIYIYEHIINFGLQHLLCVYFMCVALTKLHFYVCGVPAPLIIFHNAKHVSARVCVCVFCEDKQLVCWKPPNVILADDDVDVFSFVWWMSIH
jgi:hypothetical protein